MTDPAAYHGERIGVPNDVDGLVKLALRNGDHITGNVHPDGADLPAGGRAVDRGGIYDRGHLSIHHFGYEVALLVTAEADGVGLHVQVFLSFRLMIPLRIRPGPVDRNKVDLRIIARFLRSEEIPAQASGSKAIPSTRGGGLKNP
jgi:hypothetical protein